MKTFMKYVAFSLILACLLVAFQMYRIDYENEYINDDIYSEM